MIVEARGLSKDWAAGAPAFEDVTFTLSPGECLSLIGPSGCGKSSLLAVLAGWERASAGSLRQGGREVVGPKHTRLLLPQAQGLFPWLTARENVEFALRARGKPPAHARDLLAQVGLAEFGERYPRALSGGQQQRVSLARALAAEPELLLLDEPFSALDIISRDHLLEWLRPFLKTLGLATILVTHALDEALFFGDRVLALRGRPGRLRGELVLPARNERERLIDFKHHEAFLRMEQHLYTWLNTEPTREHPLDATDRHLDFII